MPHRLLGVRDEQRGGIDAEFVVSNSSHVVLDTLLASHACNCSTDALKSKVVRIARGESFAHEV